MTLLLFLLVLSILVLFHECGHFFAARMFGCSVEEFGFGFPPRAWAMKKGKMVWSINWIPLGGFVKIKGETGESNDKDSFSAKPFWQKAIILVAGVFMNLVLAVLLFWVGYMAGFPMAVEGLPADAVIRDHALSIEQVMPGSPAEKAGIEAGLQVIAVNGIAITTYQDFVAQAGSDRPGMIEVTVKNSETKSVKLEKAIISPGKYGIGVGLVETGSVSYGPVRAFTEAVRTTWYVTVDTLGAFKNLLANIFRGRGVGDVSGPVGIAVITGQVAKLGLIHLLQFAAMLSVNLAVLNIIPFPALDGGRLLFVGIAALRGRRTAAQFENIFHTIGFFLLMALVIVITFKDIGHYGSGIWLGFRGLLGL